MKKHNKRQKSILPGAAVGVKVISYIKKDKKTGKSETIHDINYALRSFKKEMKESNVLGEFKDRRYFQSKKDKRRKEIERAKYFQWVNDQNE